MKSTKVTKIATLKSVVTVVGVAATMFFASQPAFAAGAAGIVNDPIHTLQNGLSWADQAKQWADTVKQYKAQIDDMQARVKDFTTNPFGLISMYKDVIANARPANPITIDKIDDMVKSTNPSPSTLAKFYFPDDQACQQGSTASSILGSLVASASGAVTGAPKARLELLCIKQKELAAMAAQENFNFSKILAAYDKVIEELKGKKPTTTGEREDLRLALESFAVSRDNELSKHNTVLAYIQNQTSNMQVSQRDVEAILMRGQKPTVLGSLAQNAIVAAALAGMPTGVKGTDATRAYAN